MGLNDQDNDSVCGFQAGVELVACICNKLAN